MRQATSVFRHVHDLFEDAERLQGMPPGLPPRPRAIVPKKFVTEADFDDSALVPPESDGRGLKGQGVELEPGAGRLPLSLRTDADTMEHRHRFAQSHQGWLRFDA